MNNNVNAVITIAFRDITKLLRDKTRILANFIFPAIFIGVLGYSMESNLSESLGYNFLTFVFTGVLGQTLFQSTASGLISLVEDRQNDFAQELFVSPISRYSIVLGKIIGETMVAFVQVFGVIIFGYIIGVELDFQSILRLAPFAVMGALLGGAFGLVVMANLSEQKSANQIFPFLLFPQFFLAGVFNPIMELPPVLLILSRMAPLTYVVDLIRSIYYWGSPDYSEVVIFGPVIDSVVVLSLFVIFLSAGTAVFVKNERNK